MQLKEWHKELGEVVREFFLSPEMRQFYSVTITRERARLYLMQLGIYVRQRRNYWPQVAANCPELVVKQRILSHEYEELVEDDYSPVGHLDLIVRQGREVGLSEEEVIAAKPLPTTQAAIYAWWWIARNRPWQEALSASTIAEWTNDDRLLGDIGGGNCTRLAKSWARDLGFKPEQMPNFVAHSKADERHSEMFLDILERFVSPGGEEGVLKTAKESMDIHRAYFGGMAMAMAQLS
ncbi:MAG: iron-containing redox enzyme family protein [Candidatus Binatia bacterium]